jgi:predicted nucleic acid-binding protein
MALYTLDTSAILAYVREEPGNELVEDVLRRAEADRSHIVTVPFMAIMEVEDILTRELIPDQVDQSLGTIAAWPILIVESNEPWRHVAAGIKAGGRLSLADAWVAGLATLLGSELLHKDPEFDKLDSLKAIRLPYDRDSGGRP